MPLTPLTVGPWQGVRDTADPFDDNPYQLVDALNLYIPDPQGKSGAYARPGFQLKNSGTQLNTGYNKAICSYWALNGSVINVLWSGDKIYTMDSSFSAITDSTPTNVRIDSGASVGSNAGRPYMIVYADKMIFSDGINKPWMADPLALSSTAQTIEYQTASVILSRGSTDTAVASSAFTYQYGQVQYSQAAVATGTALPTGTIPMDQWGVFGVSIKASPTLITVTAGAANFTTGYASEAAAIAALPATPSGQWSMGYFTVKTGAGVTFVDGTDALAGGASGNPASTTNYYAGEAPPWSAFGQPCIYAGALFFIANVLSSVSSRDTILWCEPNQPTVGYEQTGYADFWNLIQDSPNPIFALGATNLALYYWRDRSIGTIVGAPGANFQSTATHDSVSTSTGTRSPGALAQFGDTFFFVDTQGRPWKFSSGTTPEPIWLQMRQQWIDNAAGAAAPNYIQFTACGAIHPELNLYLVAIWTPDVVYTKLPVDVYAFDAVTGTYEGRWQVTVTTGIGVGAIGTVRDGNRNLNLCIIGNNAAGSPGYPTNPGYVWIQYSINDGNWKDNSVVPQIQAVTSKIGYGTDVTWNARKATIIAMSNAPVNVTVQTPYTSSSTEGSALSPGASQDSTFRIPIGLDIRSARGMQFTISPTTAASQWGIEQIIVTGSPKRARVDDL